MSPASNDAGLSEQASEFATRLNDRLGRVLPEPLPSFMAQVSEAGPNAKIRVFIAPFDSGDGSDPVVVPVPLVIADRHTLHLRVEYECCWDRDERYLSIEQSKYALGVKDRPDPFFRYEFERDMNRDLPATHLHVHAHRDETTYLIAEGDRNRPRRRQARGRMPVLSEIHFPLGGHRFRPCLEDVLAVIINEFGVTAKPGWAGELRKGRAEWRRTQLKAAVRDAPREAAEVLRELGYSVGGEGSSDERTERLESL